MDIEIFSPADYLTTPWAGGATTQLFIYPRHSVYLNRNFSFRLSTATVTAETSVFTSLPGISRVLMILDGKINIHHKGHYSKTLDTFATDTFDGGWDTSSEGRCTDFNLMTTGNYTGTLSHLTLGGNTNNPYELVYEIAENSEFVFFFINAGAVSMVLNNRAFNLKQGFMLKAETPGSASVTFRTTVHSEVVVATVKTV